MCARALVTRCCVLPVVRARIPARAYTCKCARARGQPRACKSARTRARVARCDAKRGRHMQHNATSMIARQGNSHKPYWHVRCACLCSLRVRTKQSRKKKRALAPLASRHRHVRAHANVRTRTLAIINDMVSRILPLQLRCSRSYQMSLSITRHGCH